MEVRKFKIMEKIVEHHNNLDSNLTKRLSIDAAAALTAAVAVSPVMAVIDRAVTEAATGQISTLQSAKLGLLEMLRKPHHFLASKPFGIMLLLYTGTYITANSIDTLNAYHDNLPAASTTSSTTKLCAVTTINVGLALYKDSTFARTFGSPSNKAKAMPAICYLPFVVRDGITLFATFNAPAMLAPHLPDSMEKYISPLSLAQLAAPAASQFVGTPLHLLGLDLYYRSGRLTLRDRIDFIRRLWLSASTARAFRVIPAFGLGGVINNDTRAYMMGVWAER